MTARRMTGAAVVALPLMSFLVLLIANPVAAFWFARTLFARLTDPIIAPAAILSAIAGAANRGLIWPLAFAIAATGLRFAISYSMWGAGAGDAFAEHAVHAVAYALVFAIGGYIFGRAFSRPSAPTATRADRRSNHVDA